MIEIALPLTKARLGISSTVRDEYLEKIIDGVVDEMENVYGLSIDKDSPHHLMFIVDFAAWRYQNKDSHDGIPRHLQFRLHNLVIKQQVGKKNGG